jgi:hypothetical protein
LTLRLPRGRLVIFTKPCRSKIPMSSWTWAGCGAVFLPPCRPCRGSREAVSRVGAYT